MTQLVEYMIESWLPGAHLTAYKWFTKKRTCTQILTQVSSC